MAVTLTAAQLSAALRLSGSDEETAEAVRLLAFATAAVVKHAPAAPDVAHNEAAIRLAGYLFDMPNAARGAGYADSLRNSGAASLLLAYRVHRAGSTAEAVAAASTGSTSPASGTLGLRLVGEEAVTVSTGSIWIATALVVPTGPVAAVSVDADALQFFRTDALTGATAGGDASVALAGGEAYAIERGAARRLLFASTVLGAHTVWLYEVGVPV